MPPEFPNQDSESKSNAKSMTIGSNLPVVHSLSQSVLEANGWTKVGKLYLKGDNQIDYTGVHWILNGKTRVEFLEDLNDKK